MVLLARKTGSSPADAAAGSWLPSQHFQWRVSKLSWTPNILLPIPQTCTRDEAAAHRRQLIDTWRQEGQTDEVRHCILLVFVS